MVLTKEKREITICVVADYMLCLYRLDFAPQFSQYRSKVTHLIT